MEKTSTGFCCGSRAVIPLRLEVTMGKTCALEVLAEALSETDIKHVILRINPKPITAAQMFGNLDPTTGDWTMTVSAGGLYYRYHIKHGLALGKGLKSVRYQEFTKKRNQSQKRKEKKRKEIEKKEEDVVDELANQFNATMNISSKRRRIDDV